MSSTIEQQKEKLEGKTNQELGNNDDKKERPRKAKREAIQIYRPGMLRQQKLANKGDTEMQEQPKNSSLTNKTVTTSSKYGVLENADETEKFTNKNYKQGNKEVLKIKREKVAVKIKESFISDADKTKVRVENSKVLKENKEYHSTKELNLKLTREEENSCQKKKLQKSKNKRLDTDLTSLENSHKNVEKKTDKHDGSRNIKRDLIYNESTGSNNFKQKSIQPPEEFIPVKTLIFENTSNLSQNYLVQEEKKSLHSLKILDSENAHNLEMANTGESLIKNLNRSDSRDIANKNKIRNENRNTIKQIKSENENNFKSINRSNEGQEKNKLEKMYVAEILSANIESRINEHGIDKPSTSKQGPFEETRERGSINVALKEKHPDRYGESVNKPQTSHSQYQKTNDNSPATINLLNKKKEKEKNSIDELAAKVDQLAFAKQRKTQQKSLRSRTFSENDGRPDTSESRHKEIQSRGSSFKENNIERRETITQKSKLASEDSCETTKRGKEDALSRNTPYDGENSKSIGARGGKSYSSSRAQNRKNRGGSEPLSFKKESRDLSPDQQESFSKSNQICERLRKDQYALERKSESDKDQNHSLKENILKSSYKGTRRPVFGDSDSDDIGQTSKLPNKIGNYSSSSINKRSDEFKKTPEEIKPTLFVDSENEDEENWSAEVERDTSWCNQSFNATQLERSNKRVVNLASSWSDEKSSMRHKNDSYDGDSIRNKREPSAKLCRSESPGLRSGLIQIPKPTTSSNDRLSPGLPNIHSGNKTTTPSSPVGQKHLYDPNNPNKPLSVMPSARDLPPSQKESKPIQQKQDSHRNINEAYGTTVGSEQPQETVNNQKVDPSLLYSLQRGEYDIQYYVSSNQLPQEFRRIMDIRRHLQGCYKQILVTDIRLCQEKNIEGNMWKTLYYTIIEKLREYIAREPGLKERSLATLNLVVEDGLKYLTEILENLQTAYKFSIDEHVKDSGQDVSGHRNRVRLALSSSQKILLSLGDLARYKEQYSPQPNYMMARKWYEMALQVQPRNGRPFNQLAIIAVTQKRPLDVVYYYIRSLTASNPFVSARDSLISMFEDIRKKYEASKGQADAAVKTSDNPQSGDNNRTGSMHEGLRQEIWIRPDSGATHRRTLSQSTDDEASEDMHDELRKIPKDQLMKKFLTSYLHCHGMLFARVGLDFFNDVCKQMIKEFAMLLQTNPPRLTTVHLLQILAINMFAVQNTEIKDPGVGGTYRSAAQELALVLAQEMFGRLSELAVKLFPVHFQGSSNSLQPQQMQDPLAGSDPERLFTPVLAHFMPAIKTWCDWLMYFSGVWNPPASAHEYQYKSGNTWSYVAALATTVRGLNQADVPILDSKDSAELIPIRLHEDNFLRGYQPLLQAHKKTYYTSQYSHTGRAEDWLRIQQVETCLCQFLCGVDPPVLRLQKTDSEDYVVVSVVDTSRPDTPTTAGVSLSISSSHEDSESFSESDEEGEEDVDDSQGGSGDDETLHKRLFARKKVLERKHRQQRRQQETMLSNAVTVEIEVRPRYLIPDTNCFIQYLDVIQRLVELPSYTLMVPLVVLNELNGLQRDAAVAKYGSVGHAIKVREGAASAVHYLNSSKHPSIKCVTSHGSVLSSTTFTAEMDMPDATNDDKILSCCVHFQGDAQRRPVKAGVRRLYREVVLLTEDRNLRVKAHGRDVPVRDLLDFAAWAGVK